MLASKQEHRGHLTRKVEQMRRLFVSFGTDLEPLTNCCRWRRFVTLIVTITIVVVITRRCMHNRNTFIMTETRNLGEITNFQEDYHRDHHHQHVERCWSEVWTFEQDLSAIDLEARRFSLTLALRAQ